MAAELLREDDGVRTAFRELLIARYHREREILAERRAVIAWTNKASIGIFFAVHAVLAAALAAALMEFIHAFRMRRQSQAKEEQHELKLGLEGIALRTSLHGILLLGVAGGLYFLYLKFVYPVTVVTS